MAKIPSKREITKAAAKHGITIPKNHIIHSKIQNAYRAVEARGGINKIAADIEARIEAARARMANQ